MLSKMGNYFSSLSFRLLAIYLVSMLLLVGAFVAVTNYVNTDQAINDIERTLRVGPGYLHGLTAEEATTPTVPHGVRAMEVLNEYTPMVVTSGRGVIGHYGSMTEYTITSDDRIGPVTLYWDDFDSVLSTGSLVNSRLTLYFKQVSGYDDAVLVATVDRIALQAYELADRTFSNVKYISPLILTLGILFGWVISQQAITPIKRITKTTEMISQSDLSQRIKLNSKDEIGRLARSFNRMADRLQASFESQRQFVSDAAHELRTPLASMKTSVTKALSVDKGDEGYKELLIFLSGRIDTMETLTGDLLFLARSDENQLDKSKARFDVSTIISEAEEVFRYLFEDKGVCFTAKSETGLSIKADRKLILRAISNMLDNAAKNTLASNSVNLTAIREGDYAVITVSDTGSGIPEEHLGKVFQRFYKVPDSPTAKNSFGLGLSITKSIVSYFGGEISVQSEPSSGSTFTVRLPLA